MRADHAEEREIAAPEDALRELEIERVVVRHHQKVTIGRGFVHGGFGGSTGIHDDVVGQAVQSAERFHRARRPRPRERQIREHFDDRRAHAPRAEQHDRKLARSDGFSQQRAVFVETRAVPKQAIGAGDARFRVGNITESGLGPKPTLRTVDCPCVIRLFTL